jgi:hypothetical protein
MPEEHNMYTNRDEEGPKNEMCIQSVTNHQVPAFFTRLASAPQAHSSDFPGIHGHIAVHLNSSKL